MTPCPLSFDVKRKLQEVADMPVRQAADNLYLTCESRANAGFLNLESASKFGQPASREVIEMYAQIAEKAQKIVNEEITKNKKAPSLVLDMISDLQSQTSSHVTIAISGFLS